MARRPGSGVLVKRSQGWGGQATFEREPRAERVHEAEAVHDAAFAEPLAGRLCASRAEALLEGLEGKLTTSKWAKLAHCSPDTALRDILGLVEHGVLIRNPQGARSTSYALSAIAEDDR